MIAFTDKAGIQHSVENMSFEESEHGNIKCTLLGLDDFGEAVPMGQGKGFSLSVAFLQALDTLRVEA